MLNGVFLHISSSILFLIWINGVQSTVEDIDYPMETYGLSRACGQRYKNYRISDNSLAKFPWLVKLLYRDPMVSLCGGVLITEEYVLSTKDCIFSIDLLNRDAVLVGEYDTRTKWLNLRIEFISRAQKILVYKKLLHPNRNIGLIWLNNPVRTTYWVNPICLPWCRHINNQNIGEIAGWSSFKRLTKTLTNAHLHTHNISLVRDLVCAAHHDFDFRNICGITRAQKNECRGMQGGPLMMTEKYGNITRYIVVGIQAAELTICGVNGPISFINITSNMDWILDNIHSVTYLP